MKRTTLILVFLTSVTLLCHAQMRIGVKGGLNVATLSGYENAAKKLGTATQTNLVPADYAVGSTPGFHLGMVMQYDFSKNFFLQPELLFSMQGLKESGNGIEESSNLDFIQLPIYAGYRIKAGTGLDIILGAGPYLAYGISGTEGAYGDNGQFSRFDAGLSAMGGIQFNKIQITVGYDLGLVDEMNAAGWNTAKDLLGLSSINNRNLKVSLAYFFR